MGDKLHVKPLLKLAPPLEEVPLLTQEPEPVNEDLPKDGKVMGHASTRSTSTSLSADLAMVLMQDWLAHILLVGRR
ncbi:hypothetical protein L1987_85825 [Smallanthus sonchifolius]|uniref:Uncharacterized protein n=1 Tax=Smallanthus sonchifolius TaxID=185202 RepID=A0ACB8XWY0_9ASTR|nr:hypothetical protein L1987_85825 [Smallanthus sonchifolius]